jgi:thiol-disulfide isomerase/thioredoxin
MIRGPGVVLLALLLPVGACAATGTARPAPAARPHDAGAERVFARVRGAVDLDGAPVASRLAAGAPTIFVVFASWCVHCRHELGVLAELRAEAPGVQIIGLNAYEDWEDTSNEAQLRAYVAANAPWLTVVRSDAAMLRDLGGVPKIPSLFVYDGAGHLVEGYRRDQRTPPTLEELEAAVAAVTAE